MARPAQRAEDAESVSSMPGNTPESANRIELLRFSFRERARMTRLPGVFRNTFRHVSDRKNNLTVRSLDVLFGRDMLADIGRYPR
jgi:hypothetical protein